MANPKLSRNTTEKRTAKAALLMGKLGRGSTFTKTFTKWNVEAVRLKGFEGQKFGLIGLTFLQV